MVAVRMEKLVDKGKPHRLIFCNDGGTLVGPTFDAPMGEEGLVALTIEPLLGTQVDTFYWQLGTDPYLSTPSHRLSDLYSHNTEVGPIWGEDTDKFMTSGQWRVYENTRELIERGVDPPSVLIDYGHRHGLDVFLSMRVNDMHDSMLPDGHSHLSPMKKTHPDWLLGVDDDPDSGGRPGWSRFAYNFALEEVREYRLALAREAIDNYNIDGFDWDFCRSPRFFKKGTARDNTSLMTELLRSIRILLDRRSKELGRPLPLSVRVPSTFELAMTSGLDVRTWIAEGLIDILVAGVVHGSMHRVPVEEYVEACRGTGIQVIAQNLGLFWWGRAFSAGVLFGEPTVFSTEMCRASAATYWRAGVDGLYLWNNQLIRFSRDINYSGQQWREIGDPKTLKGRDKHYLANKTPARKTTATESQPPQAQPGPVPMEIDQPGDTAAVRMDIADDVMGAKAGGNLEEATLRILLVNFTSVDDLEFRLNGETLDRTGATKYILYNEYWLDFDVSSSPALRQGWNDIEIEVKSRNNRIGVPLTLDSVEAIIRYTRRT